ncbi:MAG: glycine oxidase ThiO [Gammaproteobacteria bacterium]|nr:glycine oxidase ThiO [Gammaproteobacteria bacterium]
MTCIVVGAGLIGLLTAHELALAGMDVLVLERNEPGQESSWAGGGILSPLHPWRYPQAVSELARWSQLHYPVFADYLRDKSGIDPQWVKSGLLIQGGDPEQAKNWAQQFDVRMKILDDAGIRQCEPALAEVRAPGIWLPEIAQLRNPRLLKSLRKTLQIMGVEIRCQSEVNGLDIQGDRILGVRVDGQRLAAQQVVIASGAWSGQVLNGTGLSLDVYPIKGQMLLFKAEPSVLQRIVLHHDRYVIPRCDGRVLIGSTMEDSGFDKGTSESARKELYAVATAMIPALANYPVERHWAGLRPASPDGTPFVGPHPGIDGLYINAGHFRNGVVMGYASAHLLVDQLLGREPILDVTPYLPV